MIKVLIVDDSAIARECIRSILAQDPQIEVVGTAGSGKEALAFIEHQKPDIILMDMSMPGMDGLDATRQIMETKPVPIIIVTGSCDPDSVSSSFGAMEAGAVTILDKPKVIGHPDHVVTANQLIQAIKSMSQVHVVRRWPRNRTVKTEVQSNDVLPVRLSGIQLVAIGASTGGPIVLSTILKGLPNDFSVPLLIVQHIAPGFVDGLVEWLNQHSAVPISMAKHGEALLPGRGYMAPDGVHLGVAEGNRAFLSHAEPMNGLRPAVSYLFTSVADLLGPAAIGVLLTGMGKDGAPELKILKDRGAITIAQDESSSVVHGMPGEAIKLGGATYVLPPEKIARTLVALVQEHK